MVSYTPLTFHVVILSESFIQASSVEVQGFKKIEEMVQIQKS